MKFNNIANPVCAFAIAALLLPGIANAQETKTQDRDRIQNQDATRAGNLDSKTTGTMIRASQLIGMNLQNNAEKAVGEINDIVLDARTGKIKYVAVTYGGFLGIGNDMHAVPFAAIQFKPNPNDRDETVLVLNVTQEQLEGSKGFNESTWPNFADKSFTNSIDKRYGVRNNRTYTGSQNDRHSKNRDRSSRDKNDNNGN